MQLFADLTGRQRVITTTNVHVDKKSNYRAAEVKIDPANCCDEGRAIAGKRFLCETIPSLPLEGCDADECRCKYKLFDDRRTDIRRGSDAAVDGASEYSDENHRARYSTGRRSDD